MTQPVPTPPSPLDAHLGYWLRLVSNHVSQRFARQVETLGVTVAEWVVLRELYEPEAMPPSLLADRLGMTRGAISKLADRLVAKALVTRTMSEADRRFQALSLTPAGRVLVPRLAELADRNDAECFGGMRPGARAMLAATLKGLVRQHDLTTAPID